MGASERGIWKLTAPLVYKSDLLDTVVMVPVGFVTDFCSVPRLPVIFWLCGDIATPAAVLHDYAYSKDGDIAPDRKTADALLFEAARTQGVPLWQAALLWLGVRIGGKSHWKT